MHEKNFDGKGMKLHTGKIKKMEKYIKNEK